MKTRTLGLLLTTTLILSGCGSNATTTNSTEQESSLIATSVSESTESKNNLSELEAIGSVEVEQQLFDVTLTIPKDFIGDSSQEDLNKLSEDKGFKSITLNADGSATYIMTKAQHKELMNEYREQINSDLQGMITSEDYPNITAINANDDFTEFTVTTKSTELSLSESFSVMAFYMYGGLYSVFNGTEVDNISVTFINADSGQIISTANSSDMAK